MIIRLRRSIRKMFPRSVLIYAYRFIVFRYLDSLRIVTYPDRRSILIVNHFFDQDVRALDYAADRFNLIKVNAALLFRGAKIFFRPDVQSQRSAYESEDESNRLAYRHECRLIFERLLDRFHIDVVVMTSDNFYWVREFIVVARENSIKTVVLDKEGVISPHTYEDGAHRTREFTPFVSDHIYVYSERQRIYWRSIGVSDSQITIVGQPRSDLFRREQHHAIDGYFVKRQPLVTLFSYENNAYISVLGAREGISWKVMKTQTHDAFYSLAQEHPNYNFVIKTHPQQLDLNDLKRRYDGLPNLRVLGGSAIANELIQRSELIIAFQTTAVLEAMFMNRRVLYTEWDENYEQFKDDILQFHKAPGICHAQTYEQFLYVCGRFFRGEMEDFKFTSKELEARDRFIDGYFYKPDGHVCERFFNSLSRIMNEASV